MMMESEKLFESLQSLVSAAYTASHEDDLEKLNEAYSIASSKQSSINKVFISDFGGNVNCWSAKTYEKYEMCFDAKKIICGLIWDAEELAI